MILVQGFEAVVLENCDTFETNGSSIEFWRNEEMIQMFEYSSQVAAEEAFNRICNAYGAGVKMLSV